MAENSLNATPLRFEWDPKKALRNRRLHHVTFEEAQTVFDDPYAWVVEDPDHSLDEGRAIIIGHSFKNRLLFISFAERGNLIRIISARSADPSERRLYEDEQFR